MEEKAQANMLEDYDNLNLRRSNALSMLTVCDRALCDIVAGMRPGDQRNLTEGVWCVVQATMRELGGGAYTV